MLRVHGAVRSAHGVALAVLEPWMGGAAADLSAPKLGSDCCRCCFLSSGLILGG